MRSTGERTGSPTPARLAMTRGFHEPLPFPRSGWPSVRRGVGRGGVDADSGRSPIRPAIATACAVVRAGMAATNRTPTIRNAPRTAALCTRSRRLRPRRHEDTKTLQNCIDATRLTLAAQQRDQRLVRVVLNVMQAPTR